MRRLLCVCLLVAGATTQAVQMDQYAPDVSTSSCRQSCIRHSSPGVAAACIRTEGLDAGCYRKGMLTLRRLCLKCDTKSQNPRDGNDLVPATGHLATENPLQNKVQITSEFIKPASNNDFLHCMAACLGMSVPELEAICAFCNIDIPCWVAAVGIGALICVPACAIPHKLPQTQVPLETRYLDCLDGCMDKPNAEIRAIDSKCHSDVDCWMKEDGPAAKKCVPYCGKLKTGNPPQMKTGNAPQMKTGKAPQAKMLILIARK